MGLDSLPPIWKDAPLDARGRLSATDWEKHRRSLVAGLASAVYGVTPPGGRLVSAVEFSRTLAFGGIAERREYELVVEGPLGQHRFDLLLHLPHGAERPVPLFLGLNFRGNPATTPETGVRGNAAQCAIADVEPVGSDGSPPSVRRWIVRPAGDTTGSEAASWPVRLIIERGYGVATAQASQIEEDRPAPRAPGVGSLFAVDADWGVIGRWAWGLSRALDALTGIPEVDHSTVLAVGHSRLGKTALWAAAQDARFAGAISNDSGCAGASLFRHVAGEGIAAITAAFPHWFATRLDGFAGREELLPIDQHQLLAAIAPRAVHVASASEDAWADPYGEFLSTTFATPAFCALGFDGIPGAEGTGMALTESAALAMVPPAQGTATGGRLSTHVRAGGHGMFEEDWLHFLSAADRLRETDKNNRRAL